MSELFRSEQSVVSGIHSVFLVFKYIGAALKRQEWQNP